MKVKGYDNVKTNIRMVKQNGRYFAVVTRKGVDYFINTK